MEDLVVYRVTAFSEALAEAFAGLLPQLSPRLGALSEERLRRRRSTSPSGRAASWGR